MKQLGNQDAGFIYNETPTTPMHIAGLGIYDQSTAPEGRLGHKDIIKYLQDRIHLAPVLRQKLIQVPFGIDRPYWIEDPDFDIEFHVRHIALPQPGDWRQLCILVSRLHSRPIDFSRPLWEAYIIEGLDNIEGLPKGSFGIMIKVHHSAIDGASGQGILGAIHDLTPDGMAIAPDKPLTVERIPTTLELMARSATNNITRPIGQAKAIYKRAPKLISQAIKLYRGEINSGCKLKIPQTRFNKAVTPHRVFDGTDFDLNDIKYIKNVVGQGTTVNDVMLNIVAGAVTRYLNHHHELPQESICAMLPQDIRTESDRDQYGNRVGGLFADLQSDIVDPIERLVAIHKNTTAAKELANQVDTAAVVENYMGGFLNQNLGSRFNQLVQRTKILERAGPFAVNTLITNVPGPNFPLYHAGAKLVTYWGLPPVLDCLGLGHAIFSYCGRISISANSCREMMPDPSFYIECIRASFDEILSAAKTLEAEQKAQASEEKTENKTAKAPRKRRATKKPEKEVVTRKRQISAKTNKASNTKTTVAASKTTNAKPAATTKNTEGSTEKTTNINKATGTTSNSDNTVSKPKSVATKTESSPKANSATKSEAGTETADLLTPVTDLKTAG